MTRRILVAAVLVSGAALAHDVPQKRLMNAFVNASGDRVEMVIRVPLDLMPSVRLPLKGLEIDLDKAGSALQQALASVAHDVALSEGDVELSPLSAKGRLSLPSDRSFDDFEHARAHVETPQERDVGIYSGQGFFDAHYVYPPHARLSIHTLVNAELGEYVKLAVRYRAADGGSTALLISPASGSVPLNPAWYQAGGAFVAMGVAHILSGLDHLLFLFCLLIPLIGLRQVVPIVTSFTVAHSFTLIGSAYGVAPEGAWFPPFVETAIAASIVWMALENALGADLRRRWLVTGLFGLVHGFGFSYGLRENLQFAGTHLVVSLLAFNVGIEIGQLAVLAAMLPLLAFGRRYLRLGGRAGVILLSAVAAHTGWHWMLERFSALERARWPRMDLAAIAVLSRWVVGLIAVALLVRWVTRQWSAAEPPLRSAVRALRLRA